jgi:hypothetical protein
LDHAEAAFTETGNVAMASDLLRSAIFPNPGFTAEEVTRP